MPRIGITLGDISGIGPEVSLKAVAAELESGTSSFCLIGSSSLVRDLQDRLRLDLGLDSQAGRVTLLDPLPADSLSRHEPPGSPAAARAAVAYLRKAASLCLCSELDAMVTAPVNKESIIRSGEKFIGQTELLSELAGTSRTVMMLLGADDRDRWLRVALATTHIPISQVAGSITREKVELAIELAAAACRDLGLARNRVAVCGLNPHAGEGGKIGTEEIDVIRPAVDSMKSRGFNVAGPFAADSLFHYVFRGDYEAVVAMYHDQGLVPLKMIGFERGINWTLGLPFIRTSPDHGTAYDIAGLDQADPSSMRAAIQLAEKLASERANNAVDH